MKETIRLGTNPRCPEFKKTFVIGERASIRQIVIEHPPLAATVRHLRKAPNHVVEAYFKDDGSRDEYLTRTR